MNFKPKFPTSGKDGGVDGIVRELGMDMYTLLYFKWITIKDLLYITGNPVQRYVAAPVGKEFGRGCLCMAGSLCCPPEPTTTLLISYTPLQNKKLKNAKKVKKKDLLSQRT